MHHYRLRSPRPVLAVAALAAVAAPALADPLVMGPTPLLGGSFTAFDASNSINMLGQNNVNFNNPPLVWTDNLISGGPAVQSTLQTWGNGAISMASCQTIHQLFTSPTSTTLTGQIGNQRLLVQSETVDVADALMAYAGASLFFNFTITQTAAVTMTWSTNFSGPAPTQTIMFWDITGTNPLIGSVAASSNVDNGVWTGTLAPGEYSLIYTRHDGNTSTVDTNAGTDSYFILTAEIPTPGAAAVGALALAGLAARRRR